MSRDREGELEVDPFLDDEDVLSEKWIGLAKDLLGEMQEERGTCVKQFKEAIAKDDYLEQFKDGLDEKHFTIYLRAGNWDVKVALELLKSFFNFGRDFPECVKASLPSKCGHVWEAEMISCSPVRDEWGRRVIVIHENVDWNPAIISPTELFATSFTLLATLSREPKTQIAGVSIVANARMPFHQLRFFGLEQLRCIAALFWFRKFHIVNHPRAFRIFFGLLKPFLNQRIRDIIVFHRDLQSLHQQMRPEILPPELGGTAVFGTHAEEATKQMETEIAEYVSVCQGQN